jgi:hypothetical protein
MGVTMEDPQEQGGAATAAAQADGAQVGAADVESLRRQVAERDEALRQLGNMERFPKGLEDKARAAGYRSAAEMLAALPPAAKATEEAKPKADEPFARGEAGRPLRPKRTDERFLDEEGNLDEEKYDAAVEQWDEARVEWSVEHKLSSRDRATAEATEEEAVQAAAKRAPPELVATDQDRQVYEGLLGVVASQLSGREVALPADIEVAEKAVNDWLDRAVDARLKGVKTKLDKEKEGGPTIEQGGPEGGRAPPEKPSLSLSDLDGIASVIRQRKGQT